MTDTQSLAIVLTPQELFDYEGTPYPARAIIERLVGEVARLNGVIALIRDDNEAGRRSE
jgi:hypothetical protein